jgi:hypothetical protein
MSVVNQTGTTGLDAIAQNLLRRFDSNRDGKLSADEFTSVLGALVNSLSSITANGASHASGASGATGATSGGSTALLAGFVPEKLQTSQSTKYKFGRAAMQFDLASVKDKASAEELLKSMRPAMEREGLEVLDIRGDKIKVMHEGTPIWVDVIRAASVGIDCVFQWLPEE